jgi:type I pantothenate kinase
LEARGLTLKKGFPESYDAAALRAALTAIRAGPADFPGYSHVIYDIDPSLTRRLAPPDVLIVEGLGLHEGAAAVGLDALVYLDADEADIEAWFTERLIGLWRAAEHDPTSFYARFRHLDEAGARAFAGQVWAGINLPNLREHVVAGRNVADIVVRKGADHEILSAVERS